VRFTPISAALGIVGASSTLLSLARDVAGGVNLAYGHIGCDFLSLRLIEIVFFFQLRGDSFAAAEKEVLIEPFALLVDIDSHYMDMMAVYVHVLIDYKGLFTEAEFVQILAGEDFILLL
jgi:hypothetical protein